MDEEVLVFPSHLLEKLGTFRGYSNAVESYLPTLLDPANLQYLPRSRAEEDPSFKQLIPYTVLRSGEFVYCYTRGNKGTESRLHDLLSIGVGGHISKEDGSEGRIAYDTGFQRELDEEVSIETTFTQRIVGLVHDDSTPVGSVHFGVVHRIDLAAPKVTHRDPALAKARFRPIEELRKLRDQMESWSAYAFDHVLS
ncbi:MAG: phosphoesterase [Planctomycetota bacterium]